MPPTQDKNSGSSTLSAFGIGATPTNTQQQPESRQAPAKSDDDPFAEFDGGRKKQEKKTEQSFEEIKAPQLPQYAATPV